jgi:hypothetical protein
MSTLTVAAPSFIAQLIQLSYRGDDWAKTYEIPGRIALRKLLGDTYAVYSAIEHCADPKRQYEIMAGRLLSWHKVKVHADAPNSAIVVRTVFPKLDASRISKYARAFDAARTKGISTSDEFVEFVKQAGGLEAIRLPPVVVQVLAKPAVPATTKLVPPPPLDVTDELDDAEVALYEYGDDLHALLEHRKATPFIVVPITAAQEASLDLTSRVVLLAEVVNGELRVYEQVPFDEGAIGAAMRQNYQTCDDLRAALP